MASFNALAAAIRERLLDEAPAPLPGFATIRRVHVPARVDAQPDGSRALQPPRETLRLVLGQEADSDPLAFAFARNLGLPVSQGRDVLRQHVEQLEAMLAIKGEVELEGVGIVRRTDRGLLFGADPALLATINASYQGLTTVGTPPDAPALDKEEAAVPPPPPVTAGELVMPPRVASIENGDGGDGLMSVPPPPPVSPPEPTIPEDIADASPSGEPEHPIKEDSLFASGPPADAATPLGAAPPTAGMQDDLYEDDALLPPSFGLNETPLAPEADSSFNADDSERPVSDDSSLPIEGAADLTESEWAPEAYDDELPGQTAEELPVPEAASVEDFFSTPSRPADLDDDPEASAEADAAVDDLLAGIWTTGTPRVDELGLAGTVNSNDADEAIDAHDATPAVPEFVPPVQAPVMPSEPPAKVESAGIGSPFEAPKLPDGLPTMPVGWSPTAPSEEIEYQDEGRPERSLTWLWVILGLLLIGCIAFFAWQRYGSALIASTVESNDEATQEPTTVQYEAVGDETDALGASDELLEPLGDAEESTDDVEGTPLPADVTARSASGGGTPAATNPPAGRSEATTAAAPSRDTTPSPVRSSSGAGPDLSGLSSSLASGLAGAAPIQLDAEGFTWVVSSVSDRGEANQLVDRYRTAGYRARVIEGSLNGRPMYRIAIGQFANREDAYRVRDRLPSDIRTRDDIWTLNLADV